MTELQKLNRERERLRGELARIERWIRCVDRDIEVESAKARLPLGGEFLGKSSGYETGYQYHHYKDGGWHTGPKFLWDNDCVRRRILLPIPDDVLYARVPLDRPPTIPGQTVEVFLDGEWRNVGHTFIGMDGEKFVLRAPNRMERDRYRPYEKVRRLDK